MHASSVVHTIRLGLSTGCVGLGMRDGQQRRLRLDGYADALGEFGPVQALRLEVEHQLVRGREIPETALRRHAPTVTTTAGRVSRSDYAFSAAPNAT